MAHQVEQMAYVGQTPWHGLGNHLTEKQPLEVWAREAGMDWNIRETPVCFVSGESKHLGQLQSFEDHKVLYRSDTKAPLSVVGNRYQVVQPRQILEFYRDLTEKSGFELETAGVLKGGRKLWALARTGQSGVLKGNDQSNAYVLLATACDGSMATTAQFTSVRVVCNNTLQVATGDARAQAVKVRHNTSFDAQAVKQQLGITVSAWDDFMYRLKHLAERRVTQREAERYVEAVFNSPDMPANPYVTLAPGYALGQDKLMDLPQDGEKPKRPNERAMGSVIELFEGKGMGAGLASSKGTAYGLLNAVTEFVDHQRRARSTDYRLDSAWFGQGANLKQKALDQAVLLAA